MLLSLFWKRFNTAGACWGLGVGLVGSIALIVVSPSIMGTDDKALIHGVPLYPLKNPGIVSIPLGFLAAIVATLATRETSAEERFVELTVRAHTGLGAEQATPH
jgi:cation/acetate symporter